MIVKTDLKEVILNKEKDIDRILMSLIRIKEKGKITIKIIKIILKDLIRMTERKVLEVEAEEEMILNKDKDKYLISKYF
jgi:hypothetical protein